MSACISRHGEYGEHTPDAEWFCTLCGDVDTAGLRAEVGRLRHENADLRRSRDERKATERRRRTEDREAWAREHEGEVKRLRAGIEALTATWERRMDGTEWESPGYYAAIDGCIDDLNDLLNPTEGETDA